MNPIHSTVSKAMNKPKDPNLVKVDPAWRQRWFKLDETHHKDVYKMCVEAETFIKRAVMNNPGGPRQLVIVGPTGNGKTTLCCGCESFFESLALTAWEKGWWKGHPPRMEAIYWDWLSECKRDNYVWRDMEEAQFVTVDDIAPSVDQYRSGVPMDNLRRLFDITRKKWRIFTTNIPKANWRDAWDETIEDRFHRDAIIIENNAPSWSQRK